MKSILTICALLLAFTGFSQRLEYWTDGPDTSTTVTVYNTGGTELKRPFNYTVSIFADVTGSESGTLKIEIKPVGGATYYPVKTWTGISADGYYSHSGYCLGGTMRISVLSTSSGSIAATSWVQIDPEYSGAGRQVEYWTDGPDTSATTQVILAGGGTNKNDFYYDMGLLVDVVGDTATLYVDRLPFGGATWIPFDTVASIKADTYYFYQSSAVGGKLRARVKSDGAGSSALTVWTSYARKEDD